MVNFPTSLDSLTNPTSTDQVSTVDHASQHANANDAIEALEAKVGADGSAVTTSHDYKLSGVTGSDKAVSKTGTETLTNKTLTSPTINGGTVKVAALYDTSGNETIKTPATASAVNEITVTNAATGNDPTITATGDDSNIGLTIKGKGTGTVKLGSANLVFPNADGSTSQVLKTDGAGTLSFTTVISAVQPIMSSGADGDVTISSGTTTLTRDMYYNNLTVNGTGVLVTAGYRVFVKGTCTVDATSGANINNNGGAGGNGGDGSASPGTAGTAGTVGTGGGTAFGINGQAGGAGGTPAAGNGAAGTAGTTTTYNLVNANGAAGGAGGTTGGGSGGAAGGAGTSSSASSVGMKDTMTMSFPFQFTSATAIQRANISAGSGSGGGGGANGGAGGGGGGGGSGATGGHLFLACQSLNVTGTACLQAKGGNGGNGGNGGGSGGGGGGGGGGNGGIITLVYFTKTGSGTFVVTKGSAGSAGTGVPAGSAGSAGTSDGYVYEISA